MSQEWLISSVDIQVNKTDRVPLHWSERKYHEWSNKSINNRDTECIECCEGNSSVGGIEVFWVDLLQVEESGKASLRRCQMSWGLKDGNGFAIWKARRVLQWWTARAEVWVTKNLVYLRTERRLVCWKQIHWRPQVILAFLTTVLPKSSNLPLYFHPHHYDVLHQQPDSTT